MKLSRKKAIALCIELWTWLALTGKWKDDFPKWDKYKKEFGHIDNLCWFCEYIIRQAARYTSDEDCNLYCPLITSGLVKKNADGCYDTYFKQWDKAKTPRTRKKYAKLFLEQLETLK